MHAQAATSRSRSFTLHTNRSSGPVPEVNRISEIKTARL
ncbi:MAG: hypothetical protein JWO82_1094, partial [Akkermansiaceae bacterium]|nr:hypothetical protein [Akkermansiaceae bacterium]